VENIVQETFAYWHKKIIARAKGGERVGSKDVRDLIGTVQTTKSAMGILITLREPTKQMKVSSGKN